MADIDPKCHNGRPCVKCDCMGDYGAMLREDEPDNPENPDYPRNRCSNYCTRQCCLCHQPGHG